MTEQSTPTDPGVEGTVARPGGVSYLGTPARGVRESDTGKHGSGGIPRPASSSARYAQKSASTC